MGNYETLLRDYYRREETLMKELSSSGVSPEAKSALEVAIGHIRHWFVDALQTQEQRMKELDGALHETRAALLSAQSRMEGMERENTQAAGVLFRLRGEAPESFSGPAQELQKRVEEQESVLKRRESELLSLRKQFTEAQREMDGVVERLKAQEAVLATPPAPPAPEIILPPMAPADAGETQELRRLLAASEGKSKQLEQDMEYLRLARRQIEEARDELERRLKGLEAEFQERFSRYETQLDQAKLQRQQAEAVCVRLQERLKEQEAERNRLISEHAVLAGISTSAGGEVQKLQGLLDEALKQKEQRESEVSVLRDQLLGVQSERDELQRRLQALSESRKEIETVSSAVSGDQMARLKRRLEELEDQLKKHDPDVDTLISQLKEATIFRDGLMQRIRILEAARATAIRKAEEAEAGIESVSEGMSRWQTERAEMEERMTIMQGDLANMRRAYENRERDWIETLTHQDTMRLKQISDLKDENEKLRAA